MMLMSLNRTRYKGNCRSFHPLLVWCDFTGFSGLLPVLVIQGLVSLFLVQVNAVNLAMQWKTIQSRKHRSVFATKVGFDQF